MARYELNQLEVDYLVQYVALCEKFASVDDYDHWRACEAELAKLNESYKGLADVRDSVIRTKFIASDAVERLGEWYNSSYGC